ncbi:hypothetical protein BH09MYX1_BH09MYX1_65160 [soil metagenome]
MDRRSSLRGSPNVRVWVNKYIDGYPYLAELLDISGSGLLLRTTLEPDVEAQPDSFTVEVGVPGTAHRLWLWAKNVRRDAGVQAVKLVGTELFDRAYLEQLVRWSRDAA